MVHLETVQDAVWDERRLGVTYRHSSGETAAYTLDPYGIVVKAGVWYLVAAHDGTARLWRVDRVIGATLVDERARPPADGSARDVSAVDLPALWERLRAEVEAPRAEVQVRLRIRPDLVPMVLRVTATQRSAGPEPPTRTVDGPDGDPWIEATLAFRAPRAAVAALLGFGDAVEVVGPAEVRDLVVATARSVLHRYGAAGVVS
jgi:predicted DNA-binding transcriptional regulator YafY